MKGAVVITGLDAVQPANASERTAPRRTVTVERSLLVGLLDAWQALREANAVEVFDAEAAFAEAMDDLSEAIA